MITGSEALWRSLVESGVDTVFGYPGGQIMPVYDSLCDFTDSIRHILVRHEQGAIHAAQGYARIKGVPGVVIVTSGPGATNVITGIADAMTDSTPVVVITGQVPAAALGTDAFQEADIIGLTAPISKWNYQIRRAEDVAWAVARAFYIANTGRPGPVVLDFTKDAQVGMTDFHFEKCDFIRSYIPEPKPSEVALRQAVDLLDHAERPFVVFGQGVTLSHAETALQAFLEKGDIPAGSTLLGLSALPSDFPLYQGMIGMHGNVAPNIMTNQCDVLIAVGMRFDDRVTGTVSTYARQAKVIHIDIDTSEIGKIIPVTVGIRGDARKVLTELTSRMQERHHPEWVAGFAPCLAREKAMVIDPEIRPGNGLIRMGEVIDGVSRVTKCKAVIVTDVGQNQMMAARYSRFCAARSFISSGGLGTMGFGLPAAIGAKIADPRRPVCLFVGDGGIQMTLQEFGTIMQERIGVKIVLLNNNWLGNVRQWQQLFFGERYSQTRMLNPDYALIARAYGIRCQTVERREELEPALRDLFADDEPCLLNVHVLETGNVMPMIPPGKGIHEIMLTETEWYS
ncbi:MAG: biosynthetic-type acetolactate synthase large subunit [Bacteroidales bacterium]|nr:biosynthetic-type acetolactate synthase large subunit [Bacteroidales bacterium]